MTHREERRSIELERALAIPYEHYRMRAARLRSEAVREAYRSLGGWLRALPGRIGAGNARRAPSTLNACTARG
ncbi:MAG: hypothetical protein R3E48_18730 [Burkholderiaceae bacterium]